MIREQLERGRLAATLLGLGWLLKARARFDRNFRAFSQLHTCVAQIQTRDGRVSRHYLFDGKRIRDRRGRHPSPDLVLSFSSAGVGCRLLAPPIDWHEQVHSQKNFQLEQKGSDELTIWFARVVMRATRIPAQTGTKMPDGTVRNTTMTNGGPCFVSTKDNRIVRIMPIDFEDADGKSWEICAHDRVLAPPRKATVAPHALSWKSTVYSKDRLLFPLKRVDFDPNGERNPQGRGTSGYERISWDEALDIVSGEIRRVKQTYGPAAITFNHSSHHSWGNIGYMTSALLRFANMIGHTKVNHNPDSWEGWYWGATHHWGQSMRLGLAEPYRTVEDLLQNAELVVFWSADPEGTNGLYGGQEGTVRRLWLKELGIPTVHIDPYFNHTAAFLKGKWISPRPGTDTALALALAYVWITEGLYDREFVSKRTQGFDIWKNYIVGLDDGVPKTPAWQEAETGVPAEVVRSLARQWGSKRTYLGAGGWGTGLGGAGRGPTGHQWARAMVCLNALQGFGREGVNFGHLQWGTPVDLDFWFPGYADGGIGGDLANTTSAIALYQRMPHLPTMNSVVPQIPRMRFPEGIMTGTAEGFPRDSRSLQGQFNKIRYPAPGAPPIHLIYKYGSSNFGTMAESRRYADMYRSENVQFVVNQSIWREGDATFADVILPACTSFERWDISEWSSLSGYAHHGQGQLNHRVITLQHKCIEPLGESKSDYDIFTAVAGRLGMGALYSEGMDELGWVQRMFEASDLPKVISWRKLLKKGYYVVPAPETAALPPRAFQWFYEGRKKDVPEPHPLVSEHTGDFREGLQTQSTKFEFECQSLKRFAPDDEERPPILRYNRSWEGHGSERQKDFPLQLLTPHSRFSFHTEADGKDAFANDIAEHRMLVDGHYYLTLRISTEDAQSRGIRRCDLVRVFNDRASVICAAMPTSRLRPGVLHGYESSAKFESVGSPDQKIDRGGCLNTLTSKRPQITNSHSLAASACLVQVELWKDIGFPAVVQDGSRMKVEAHS